jgi:hypothetical protein
MLFLSSRVTISQICINLLAAEFNCFSEAALKLQTAILKLHGDFLQSPGEGVHRFQEALEKPWVALV